MSCLDTSENLPAYFSPSLGALFLCDSRRLSTNLSLFASHHAAASSVYIESLDGDQAGGTDSLRPEPEMFLFQVSRIAQSRERHLAGSPVYIGKLGLEERYDLMLYTPVPTHRQAECGIRSTTGFLARSELGR